MNKSRAGAKPPTTPQENPKQTQKPNEHIVLTTVCKHSANNAGKVYRASDDKGESTL